MTAVISSSRFLPRHLGGGGWMEWKGGEGDRPRERLVVEMGRSVSRRLINEQGSETDGYLLP